MKDFFERYAHRIGEPTRRGCREWRGARTTAGYGHGRRDSEHFYAHRAAYESAHGVGSADGMIVRHHCDNPSCVEPKHLEIGTCSDNAFDSVERGRAHRARGERHPRAKLTRKQVIAIRRALSAGKHGTELAVIYGVHHNTIYSISDGQSWGWL